MKQDGRKASLRCAIYTRVSTENGLEQEFNSLDNQREASEAYIRSQAHEGWKLIRDRYDDGGFSGGSMDRPALAKLLDDVRARRVDVIVVYKVDRLTRSLADFAKLVELFDEHDVSFISVTQAFNTTTSMGRLTLNMLLSFAQFEREITGERIRDKVAASKKRGIWMGGAVPFGYRVENRALHIVEEHAEFVRDLFRRYLEVGSVVRLKIVLDAENVRLPVRVAGTGRAIGRRPDLSRPHLLDPLQPDLCRTASPQGPDPRRLAYRDRRPRNLGPRPTPACSANATKGGSPSQCRILSRRQALRRSGQSDGPEPCRQRRTALALLHFASDPHGSQVRRRIGHSRPRGPDRETGVRCDQKRHRIQTLRSTELGALSRVGFSGNTVGSHPRRATNA